MRKHKMSIFGLTLTYKEKDGSLILDKNDFKAAKSTFPSIPSYLKGMSLARIEALVKGNLAKLSDDSTTPLPPCKPKWSNAFRIVLEDMKGKCLHFTAASTGAIEVLFSAKPGSEKDRYRVVIDPKVVTIFKVRKPCWKRFRLRLQQKNLLVKYMYLRVVSNFFLIILTQLIWLGWELK